MAREKTQLLVAHDLGTGSDHKKRNAAIQAYSTALAKKLSAGIEIVHAENLNPFSVRSTSYQPMIDFYLKRQSAALQIIAKQFSIPVRTQSVNGDPVQSLLKRGARGGKTEMLIMGTHARTGIKRLLLGSVAEEVMRQSTIPVMAIGPKALSAKAPLTKSELTLFVPTSLTPNTARAETYAVKLAKRLGASIVFFHSLREAMHPALQTAFSSQVPSTELQSYWTDLKSTAQKDIQRRVEKAKSAGVKAQAILEDRNHDSADAALKEIARTKADLVVMGTHGRSMIGGMFFGRTAREVILGSSVPVITVRSKGA